ncbi:HU family DNA-binding protein [uncultured Parabacteroides sp.]|jgi:predicted histone-like DNA-binding protein|uniref:HU family DNA-binding protein n=1 Tax=uncultured Parabacteroides sp. TaxID=512312 RepID=UPI0025E2FAB7|nr:HU family DNA-binding protein [uncultured Parabacteroides sp.]
MAIKFKVYSTPKPNSRKGSKLSHARAISQGTYNLEKVCKLISERSAVSSAEVKSVLDSFAWVIELALEDGCHVELDDLGYFSPSLKTVPSKKDGTKNTVYVDGINYRCSTSLREKLRGIDLTYVKEKKKPDSWEERKKKLLSYIATWDSISPRGYAEAVGCSRYRAETDLKKFVEEGVLVRVGYRNKVMYLLANNE